jgi:hypothetical protein
MKKGSSGGHGGGHKARDRGRNASERKASERSKQAKIAKARGQRDRSGKKPKDDGGGEGRGPKGDE